MTDSVHLKRLHMNFWFDLPDDFQGTPLEAARIAIDFLSQNKSELATRATFPPSPDMYREIHQTFELNRRIGVRFTGFIKLVRWSNNGWKPMDFELNAHRGNKGDVLK